MTGRMTGRAGQAAAALLVVGLGAALRGWGLFRDPLWLDEAYSAYAAAGGFGFLWRVVPLYETHPPFYYSLVRCWTLLFGDSLAALRGMGFVAGVLVMPAAWWAARGLGRLAGLRARALPLAALAFAALATGLIEMAREVRPYALMALVYAVTMGLLFRAAAPVAETGRLRGRAFAGYCAGLALMLWLHNLGPLYGLALGLAALVLIARRGLPGATWGRFVAGHVAAGLVYLPGFLILADQAPTWVRSTWLRFTPDERLPGTLAMLWGTGEQTILPAILILFGLGAAALARTRQGARAAAALLVLAMLPLALSIAVSLTVTPVFIPRTMTPVAVPAALLMAAAVAGSRGRLRWAAWFAGVLLAMRMLANDIDYRRAERPMQDFYAALRWLGPRFRPGDMVLAYPNEGALPFDRAVRDKGLAIPSRAIPAPVPAFADAPGKWNPTGSRGVVALSRPRLRAIAQSAQTRAIPTVWLLRLGPWAYDKGDVFLDELRRDRVVTGHVLIGAIDITGLRRKPAGGPGLSPPRAAPAGAAAAR